MQQLLLVVTAVVRHDDKPNHAACLYYDVAVLWKLLLLPTVEPAAIRRPLSRSCFAVPYKKESLRQVR